jgi:hypothetical protein
MIYSNQESAKKWAAILNSRPGHVRVDAVETSLGWTVR